MGTPPALIAAAAKGRGKTPTRLWLISLVFYLFPFLYAVSLRLFHLAGAWRPLAPWREPVGRDVASQGEDIRWHGYGSTTLFGNQKCLLFPPSVKYSPCKTAFVHFSESTGCNPSSKFHADATVTPVWAVSTHNAPHFKWLCFQKEILKTLKIGQKFFHTANKSNQWKKKNNKIMLFLLYPEDTNDSARCCRLMGWLTLLIEKHSAV